MRILHIHPSLKTGGIESMINGLANEMSKNNDVFVCSIFEQNDNNIYWRTLSPKVSKISLGKKNKGFSLSEIIKIYNYIRKGNFDVVNIHGFFHYYFLAVLLLHKKTRFFYTVHSDAKMENTPWEWRIFKLKKMSFSKGWIRPITISNESQKSFETLYQCRSHLIPNGIPIPQVNHTQKKIINKFRFSPSTKILINIGRIDTPKNQIVLCDSVQYLVNKGYDIVLLIAGPIAKNDIFEEIKKRLNNRIIYLGEIHNAPDFFSECDAFVMPSIWEGLPITLLEAMSVGCIPICSPVGGIPNVVLDEKNGFLSESASFEDFTRTLKRYLSASESIIHEIKYNAYHDFVEKYTIQTTVAEYIQYYSNHQS